MQISRTVFGRHKAVELKTAAFRMVVVTDMGPRIAHFSPLKGANLLFWDGKNKYSRGKWLLKGGHRVWTTRPGADESEESYLDDNSAGSVSETDEGVVFCGSPHKTFGIRKGFTVCQVAENVVDIENFVINESDMLWSGGVWSITCTDPSGGASYGIPLGDDSGWDSFNMTYFKKWGGGHTARVNDPQIAMTENMLLVKPRGVEAKRALEAPLGMIGMLAKKQKCSFFKIAPPVKGMTYPCGCNVAFYIGPKNFMVEMETMSPEVTLKPGEMLANTERWVLTDPIDWSQTAKIRKIARQD